MTLTDHGAPLHPTDDELTPDLALLAEADDTDDTDGDDSQANTADTSRTKGARSRSASRGTSKVTVRTVRTILAKHAEISAASNADRALLATLLGVRNDEDELVAHILSTPRLSLAGVDELEAIIEVAKVSPWDAVERAITYESAGRAIWSILSALGTVDGNRPQKESDASLAIARAASQITDAQTGRLNTLRELIRKGQ